MTQSHPPRSITRWKNWVKNNGNLKPGKKQKIFENPGKIWLFKNVYLRKPREKLLIFDFPWWQIGATFDPVTKNSQWIFLISKSSWWVFKTYRVTETGVYKILHNYINCMVLQKKVLFSLHLYILPALAQWLLVDHSVWTCYFERSLAIAHTQVVWSLSFTPTTIFPCGTSHCDQLKAVLEERLTVSIVLQAVRTHK